jgi:MscS family membrane protein
MRKLGLLLPALVLAAPLTVRAEAPPPTTTTVPPAEHAAPPRSPLDYGPDVPRGAVARFLQAAHDGHYARAAEYLNLRQLPSKTRPQRGAELARELGAVLERALWVDPEKVSDRPDGDPDDGLPPFRDSLGTIETSTGPVEILIERVKDNGNGPAWKIAASTVAAIPALYEEFGWGPLADYLPAPFFEVRFLHVRLWQWIALVALVALAWLVSRLVHRPLVAIAGRIFTARSAGDAALAEHSAAPLQLAAGVLVFAVGLRFLALALPVERTLVGAEKAFAIVAATWLLLRALDVAAMRVERRLGAQRSRAVATVPLGRRSLKVFVAVIAFIAALQNFGFNVTGLLAGLGVGGLAVALAAQKTVENLFGSVSLVADQPVRVGDVCRFGDTVGTVEDIGLRSTRVRTVDRTLVTIPNAQFSTLPLENLSRRDRIPIRATLTLPQGTTADRVRAILAALREGAAAQPKIDRDSVRVRFVRLDPQALQIELFAYALTRDWDEFVDVRQQVLLAALDVVTTTPGSGERSA